MSEQVHYPAASFEEGIVSTFLLREKNGESKHGCSCALNNDRQKVRKLMVTVQEIIDNFCLNNTDHCHQKRRKQAIVKIR